MLKLASYNKLYHTYILIKKIMITHIILKTIRNKIIMVAFHFQFIKKFSQCAGLRVYEALTVYSVECTLYTVQCTVYTLFN